MTAPVQPDTSSKKPHYGMDKDDPRVKFALKPLNKTPSDSLAVDSATKAEHKKAALKRMMARLKGKKNASNK